MKANYFKTKVKASPKIISLIFHKDIRQRTDVYVKPCETSLTLGFHYRADKTFTSKSQRLNKGKEMFFVKQSGNH